jgi:hypothetical protein
MTHRPILYRIRDILVINRSLYIIEEQQLVHYVF